MADLALGYSKTALDFVVNKVQSAIKEEEEQWQTVQRDLEFITGEFEMMQSFLATADGERLKSLVVRTWVQQVRILSYDVEDSIDFVLQLDSSKQPWWLRLLPSWMKKAPEAPVDEAVAEITQLKARVVDVSNRNTRYNLVTDSSAKPVAFHVLDGSQCNIHDLPYELEKCFKVDVESLRVMCVLSETVGNDRGTLSFIRQLYQETSLWDFKVRAWVKLMHPFNPHEFIRSLLAQFLRSSCEVEGEKILGLEVMTKMEEIQVINDQFKHEVNKHKYLIVLEGVSSMEEWDAIKTYLPDRMNNSRIIVWTHHVEIATLCTGMPYRSFLIQQSSPHHPSYIFFRKDSKDDDDDDEEEEEEEALCPDGREEEAMQLSWAVMNRCRVALFGCPGVGKTELARAVYYSLQGLDQSAFKEGAVSGYHPFTQKAWANVPEHFYDADSIARDILLGLKKKKKKKNTYKRGNLVNTCRFALERCTGRTLVVLDGVRSMEDWDRINDILLCAMQPDSCVLVITPSWSLAEYITDDHSVGMVVSVEPLAADPEVENPLPAKKRKDPLPKKKERKEAGKDENFIVGRRVEANELLRMVMRTDSRRISVWGPQGVGKTALVRALYGVVKEEKYGGFVIRIWIDVPEPLVNIKGISSDIISEINWSGFSMQTDNVSYYLEVVTARKRTLVVFDGVRSKEDWDMIAEITSAMQLGSCVVVITEDESIAAHCAGRSDVDNVLRVNPLGVAAARRLFHRTLREYTRWDGDEASLLRELEESRTLLSKCSGLPLFVRRVAFHVAYRFSKNRRIQEMKHLNDNFNRQLQNKQDFRDLRYTLAWVHSKFDGSPTLLKKCIFYLSLFPRDGNIQRKRLVRRWIAEGYCSNEEADNLIGKVSGLYLVQPWETVILVPSAMGKTSCQVNYSFLDYIISRQTEEKTFLPLEISVLDARCTSPINRVGQHLAIRSDWGRDKAAYISMELSRLRSLTASGEWKSFLIPQKMRVLRVLDLEGTWNLQDVDLDEIGQLTPRLKFLSLRRCRPISRLPVSLGDLLLLETLDIRHTLITELPEEITKLQKLQHIRAGTTQGGSSGPDVPNPTQAAAPTPATSAGTSAEPAMPSQQDERQPGQSWGSTLFACLFKSPGDFTGGVRIHRGMEGMKALQTLGVVDVDTPGGEALLAELSKIKKKEKKNKKTGVESHPLRNLSLCGLDWSRNLLHYIARLDQLESLSLRAEEFQVKHFNLPPNIVKFRLDVAGILHQFVVHAIKHHGKLENLRLHAKEVEHGTVCFYAATEPGESAATKAGESDSGSFSEVKNLEISCSSSLHVMFSQQGMQKLELLKVHCHSGLPLEISGLDQLSALKQVWLIGSYDNTLKEALKKDLLEHPKKPALYIKEQDFFEDVMEEQGSP